MLPLLSINCDLSEWETNGSAATNLIMLLYNIIIIKVVLYTP